MILMIGDYDDDGARKLRQETLSGNLRLVLWHNPSGRYCVCLHGHSDDEWFMSTTRKREEDAEDLLDTVQALIN